MLSEEKYDVIDFPASTGIISRLDLHGKTRKESEQYILERLASCRTRFDIQKLFIITGRGNHVLPTGQRGVLFKWLPKWLKSCEFKDDIYEVNSSIGCYEIIFKEKKPDVILSRFFERSFLINICRPELLNALERKPAKTPEELFMLGVGYIYAMDEKVGLSKGIAYLAQAADQEYINAIKILGHLYHMGIPGKLKPNYKKGAKLFLRAEALGCQDPELLHELARCYFLGQGVRQNDETAFAYLEVASQAGSAESQFTLGVEYLEGGHYSETFEIKQDFIKAHHYLSMAAENKFSAAYRKLAILYQHGRGVEKDMAKAFAWYKKGAAAGDIFCIHNVGVGYSGDLDDGDIGEPLDHIKSYEYLKRAADLGDSDSEFEVGRCLFLGRGVADDFEQAIQYFKRAQRHGNPRAYYFCGVTAVLKNEAKQAIQYLEEGCIQKDEHGVICQLLLKTLQEKKWLEKMVQEQHDFILSISEDMDQFFNSCLVDRVIFGKLFLELMLNDFLKFWPEMRTVENGAWNFVDRMTVLAFKIGYRYNHSMILTFQSYASLIEINNYIIGQSKDTIKAIKERFEERVLSGLLPSHSETVTNLVQHAHRYIINYLVTEQLIAQDRYTQAIAILKQSQDLFLKGTIAYTLIAPSIRRITAKVIKFLVQQEMGKISFSVDLPVRLEYLERLRNILGKGPDRDDIVSFNQKKTTVYFPAFWLKQISTEAVEQLILEAGISIKR